MPDSTETVRVCVYKFPGNSAIFVDFSHILQRRGRDVTVHAYAGYEPDEHDTKVGVIVLKALFDADHTGVMQATVRSHQLELQLSLAVGLNELEAVIVDAFKEAEFQVDLTYS